MYRVRLPRMDQFSIIDKNKETHNKYCFKYLAVFSLRKPNFTKVTDRQLFEKKNLFYFASGPFTALGCHEWTTLFPSKDHMHNIEKCRFTCALMYCIL